jgi:hypothetical protein
VNQFVEQANIDEYPSAANVALSQDGKQVCFVRGGWKDNYLVVREVETGAEVVIWKDLPAVFCRVAAIGPGKFRLVSEELEGKEEPGKGRRLKTVVRDFDVDKKEFSEKVLRKSEATDIGMFLIHYLSADGKTYFWSGPRYSDVLGTRRVQLFDVDSGKPIPFGDPKDEKLGGGWMSSDGKRLWYHRRVDEIDKGFRVDLNDPKTEIDDKNLLAVSADAKWVIRHGTRSKFLNHAEIAESLDGPNWVHLFNLDQSGLRGEGHPISPNGKYFVFGSMPGALTIVDLTELKTRVKDFEGKFTTDSR